jgi:hypothetical protein
VCDPIGIVWGGRQNSVRSNSSSFNRVMNTKSFLRHWSCTTTQVLPVDVVSLIESTLGPANKAGFVHVSRVKSVLPLKTPIGQTRVLGLFYTFTRQSGTKRFNISKLGFAADKPRKTSESFVFVRFLVNFRLKLPVNANRWIEADRNDRQGEGGRMRSFYHTSSVNGSATRSVCLVRLRPAKSPFRLPAGNIQRR